MLEEQGSTMGTDLDSLILIPLTAAKYLESDTTINNMYVKVTDENLINISTALLENYIRSTLQISSDYYSVTSQESTLEAMESINNTLSLLLRRNSKYFVSSWWNWGYECNASFCN